MRLANYCVVEHLGHEVLRTAMCALFCQKPFVTATMRLANYCCIVQYLGHEVLRRAMCVPFPMPSSGVSDHNYIITFCSACRASQTSMQHGCWQWAAVAACDVPSTLRPARCCFRMLDPTQAVPLQFSFPRCINVMMSASGLSFVPELLHTTGPG